MIHFQLHTTAVRVSLIPAYVVAPYHACHRQLGKYNSKQQHGTAVDNDDEATTEQLTAILYLSRNVYDNNDEIIVDNAQYCCVSRLANV
jgi:hypothetical protein